MSWAGIRETQWDNNELIEELAIQKGEKE